MKWAEQRIKDANTIAIFLQGSGLARQLVCTPIGAASAR
jgi:hypothetical protein